jgi:Lamin Tail Domain
MVSRIFFSLFVFGFALVGSQFLTPIYAQNSDIYISEIQFDGSTAGEHDKWIELYNPSGSTINLAGYSLAFKSGKPFMLDGLSINSNSTLLVVNNVNPTASLLYKSSEFGNTTKTNLLHAFNSSTNPYIHVQLYSGSNLVSSFVKGEGETRRLMGTKTVKKSIEIDQNGSFILSNSLYFGANNFGSPGRIAVLQAQQTSTNSLVTSPFQSVAQTINDVVNPVVEPVLTPQPSLQPALQSSQSPVSVDVSRLSEIKVSIPSVSDIPLLNKEIRFSSIPKSRFSNSLYPAYSQFPLMLVTVVSLIKSSFETTPRDSKKTQTA